MYVPRTQINHRHHHQQTQNYRSRAGSKFISNGRNPAQNYQSGNSNFYGNHQEAVQFKPNQTTESDDSGVCSPPLWKNTVPSPSNTLLTQQNYRSLSPNSRTQSIIRGQMELMDMVKNMPESSYELSLRDIVDPRIETQVYQTEEQRSPNRVKIRKENKRKNVMRSGDFENKGLFLNMMFPFSLKLEKKKNFGSNIMSGKVSPKPERVKGSGEKDWWKKRFTGSSGSDSNITGSKGSSDGSCSSLSYSGSRKENGSLSGCWPCLQSRSSKSV